MIITISALPSGEQLQKALFFDRPDGPKLPWIAKSFLNINDYICKLRARRWGVEYEYIFLDTNTADLNFMCQCIEEGKVVPVVGTKAPLRDIEKVRAACNTVYRAKGGIGKAVFEVIED